MEWTDEKNKNSRIESWVALQIQDFCLFGFTEKWLLIASFLPVQNTNSPNHKRKSERFGDGVRMARVHKFHAFNTPTPNSFKQVIKVTVHPLNWKQILTQTSPPPWRFLGLLLLRHVCFWSLYPWKALRPGANRWLNENRMWTMP